MATGQPGAPPRTGGPPVTFTMTKTNRLGKAQTRRLTVSAQGIKNEDGKQWFYGTADVKKLSQPDPSDARHLKLEVLKTYPFECANEAEAHRLVTRMHLRGLGKRTRSSSSVHSVEQAQRIVLLQEQIAAANQRRDTLRLELEGLRALHGLR